MAETRERGALVGATSAEGKPLLLPQRSRAQPEAIIFVGLQGAGKSTFYRERFFATHLRISLDMLRTRRREALILDACLAGAISFVVDNTNPARDDRARYIAAARQAGFRITGYHFDLAIAVCLSRNAARPAAERIPPRGIYGTRKRLQPPTHGEGFDLLNRVSLDPTGVLITEPIGAEHAIGS